MQRSSVDFAPKNADGTRAAFDSSIADNQPKSIAGFAMDAPSQGNVGSMKPLINPLEMLPCAQLTWYANQGFIGYQIMGIIAQHWMVSKICRMPAEDAMRHGYDIATEDDEELDPKVLAYIKKRDKDFKIKQNCVELVKFNRVFGIRVAMFIIETDDPDFYTNPFNIDGVTPNSYKGISQIDPYWMTPELSFASGANPADINFYTPTWWRVNGKRIHYTHLIVVTGDEVVDVLKPSYLYGGISIPQKICERVFASERTANEAPQLALTKRLNVIKMDMMAAIANQWEFQQKMEWAAYTRDNYGSRVIGLEDEAMQFDTSLAEFPTLIMQQYQIACAAGDCPASKVMADSPKGGLGANGDYESDSYHEFLETIQEHYMQPMVERHHLLLIKSEIEPKFKVFPNISISWNPTDSPTAKEQAELNKIKADTAKTLAECGAVMGEDIRTNIMLDKNSGWNGLEENSEISDPDFIPEPNRRETDRQDDGDQTEE